jgi:hypothetical protein
MTTNTPPRSTHCGLNPSQICREESETPHYAINDPRVPANECSPDNSAAVGDPVDPGNPGINLHTPQVSPFVSGNNPGVSTGALGQQNSNAIGTCPNSLP